MTIDITRAHIGRIYDYVLGGTQNYEADRRAAEAILELVPAYPRWARINRSFLSHVGQRWSAQGIKGVLDLGSGLPTQGHFNEHLPDAKILFSDFDPLTVAQAQQLLAYTPDMAYANIDLKDPDTLVEQASSYFGADRPLAVGAIGIVYFLTDDHIRDLMRHLHAFCAPGTEMALSFHHLPPEAGSAAADRVLSETQKHAGIDIFLRTPEQMAELIVPWRLTVSKPIQDWLGKDDTTVALPPARPDDPFNELILVGAFAEH
jgi:O-methyltransferase involved in polyketide biosynthesis